MKITHLLVASLLLSCSYSATGAVIQFQQGVSPSGSYTIENVTLRSDGSGTNVADTNQNPDELIVGRFNVGARTDLFRSLIQFDLTELESQIGANPYTINSVSLVLNDQSSLSDSGSTSRTFQLQRYDFTVDEDVATWNSPATGDSTAGGTAGTLLSSTSFVLDSTGNPDRTFGSTSNFTQAISDVVDGAGSTIAFRVISPELEGLSEDNFVRFESTFTAPNAGLGPELIVEGSWDCGSGLVAGQDRGGCGDPG